MLDAYNTAGTGNGNEETARRIPVQPSVRDLDRQAWEHEQARLRRQEEDAQRRYQGYEIVQITEVTGFNATDVLCM